MPTFRYSAYTAGGRETSGTVEAESLKEAKLRLKRDGLYPRDIGPVSETAGTVSRRFGGRSAGPAQVALMTRRLATLVGSQVPIYEAVTTLWEQEDPGEIKKALGRIRERLAEGANLAKALSLEPRLFSESYVAMVAAGEASGALDAVLERVALFPRGTAGHSEQNHRLAGLPDAHGPGGKRGNALPPGLCHSQDRHHL